MEDGNTRLEHGAQLAREQNDVFIPNPFAKPAGDKVFLPRCYRHDLNGHKFILRQLFKGGVFILGADLTGDDASGQITGTICIFTHTIARAAH